MYIIVRDDVDGYPSVQGTYEFPPTVEQVVDLMEPYYDVPEDCETWAHELIVYGEVFIGDSSGTFYRLDRA